MYKNINKFITRIMLKSHCMCDFSVNDSCSWQSWPLGGSGTQCLYCGSDQLNAISHLPAANMTVYDSLNDLLSQVKSVMFEWWWISFLSTCVLFSESRWPPAVLQQPTLVCCVENLFGLVVNHFTSSLSLVCEHALVSKKKESDT